MQVELVLWEAEEEPQEVKAPLPLRNKEVAEADKMPSIWEDECEIITD
jgi:hypothetical protein